MENLKLESVPNKAPIKKNFPVLIDNFDPQILVSNGFLIYLRHEVKVSQIYISSIRIINQI
jgi:hypothetical protein